MKPALGDSGFEGHIVEQSFHEYRMAGACAEATDWHRERHRDRRVLGMGHVGLPLAIAFCKANCPVPAFDFDVAKVDALNAGRSYIKHIDATRVAPQVS